MLSVHHRPDQRSLQTARVLHFYDKEVSFYRFLASELPIRTPKCFFAQRDEDDNFLLLLEDLSPSAAVDQFIGISLEVAKNGLKALAGLHGCTFMKGELFQSSWLHLESEEDVHKKMALSTVFDAFLESMAKQIDDATLKTVMAIKERLIQPQSIYVPPKPCLVHRDFRTDNLLIDARDGEVPLATVDWQTVTVGSPMLDVAYFLVNSLTKEDCMQYEHELIGYYLERLRDNGVELAHQEYKRYTLEPVVIAVVAWIVVEKTERGDSLFRLMMDKGLAAVTRWKALEN